jgi:hypothetical protein
MTKVEFNLENLNKCICGTCPVQVESECYQEKMMITRDMMPEIEEGEIPEPEKVLEVYCATRKTTCSDFDFEKMCQCNECPIWAECDLMSGEPMGYFCRDGEAR